MDEEEGRGDYTSEDGPSEAAIAIAKKLAGSHLRVSAALAWNVEALAKKHGLNRLAFVTLTFKDKVLAMKEAQRRFRSFKEGVLRKRFVEWIAVPQRHKDNRVHFHLLVVVQFDMKPEEFPWEDMELPRKIRYRRVDKRLKEEWAFMRETCPKYKFGRSEMLPVRSTAEAIGKYIGSYIGKHIELRKVADKGARLVLYSRGARMATSRFGWAGEMARAWRLKVKVFMMLKGVTDPKHGNEKQLGKGWAYKNQDAIGNLTLYYKNTPIPNNIEGYRWANWCWADVVRDTLLHYATNTEHKMHHSVTKKGAEKRLLEWLAARVDNYEKNIV